MVILRLGHMSPCMDGIELPGGAQPEKARHQLRRMKSCCDKCHMSTPPKRHRSVRCAAVAVSAAEDKPLSQTGYIFPVQFAATVKGMQIPLIQIDAFATKPFEGNPAAVMPLEGWLGDRVLQQLAEENNLSETAFIVAVIPDQATPFDSSQPAYHLRWFTPAIEVDLCGHATLATASYLFTDVHPDAKRLQFWSRSGWLL